MRDAPGLADEPAHRPHGLDAARARAGVRLHERRDVGARDRRDAQPACDLRHEQLIADDVAGDCGRRALDLQELPVLAALPANAPAITLRSARRSAVGPTVVRVRTRLRSSSAVRAPALVTPAAVSAVSSAGRERAAGVAALQRRREIERTRGQVGIEAGDGRGRGVAERRVARPQVGAGRGLLVGVGAARRRERPPPPRPDGREPELARDGEAGLRLELDDLEPRRRRLQPRPAAVGVTRLEAEHQPDARGRDAERGQAARPTRGSPRGSRG